jgi:diaminopimelate epimerase
MGAPILNPADIPTTLTGDPAVAVPLEVLGKTYSVTPVSMGNPHCVLFLDEDVNRLDLAAIGPAFENHPAFPERVNTEFIQVIGENELNMRVWERGSGETWACGTGACASAVAAVLNGRCDRKRPILLHLRGGDLSIRWEEDAVYMTGPAETIFDGTINI